MTVTTEGGRPGEGAAADGIDEAQLGRVGRAAERLLGSLDARGLELARGTSTYVYAGGRVIRGLGDRLPLRGAPRAVPARARRPPRPAASARARRRPGRPQLPEAARLLALDRGRLLPPRTGRAPGRQAPRSPSTRQRRRQVTGRASASRRSSLVGLGAGSSPAGGSSTRPGTATRTRSPASPSRSHRLAPDQLVLIATNIYALIFVLPSAHAWLWLIELRGRRALVKSGRLCRRLLGPAVLAPVVRRPLRARSRRALVPCGARRHRLRTAHGGHPLPRLARRRRPGARGDQRALRAVSGAAQSARRVGRSGASSPPRAAHRRDEVMPS